MPKCKCGCGENCTQTYARGHNPTAEGSDLSTLHIRGPISKRQRPRGKPKIDRFVAENGLSYAELCEFQRQQRVQFYESEKRREVQAPS